MKVYIITWTHNNFAETTQIEAFRTKKEQYKRFAEITRESKNDSNITIGDWSNRCVVVKNKSDLVKLLNSLTSWG